MKTRIAVEVSVFLCVVAILLYGTFRVVRHVVLENEQPPVKPFDLKLLATDPVSGPAAPRLLPAVTLSEPRDSLSPIQRQIYALIEGGKFDEALEQLNSMMQPGESGVWVDNLRGMVYAKKQQWSEARQEFIKVQQVDPQSVPAKFNLAEIGFMQKQYSVVRPQFAALEKDPDYGDLASYKVFLCDLFGGQDADASHDLDAFDLTGANPSYYFSHVAWDLYHQNPGEARVWLDRGSRIYYPAKVDLYTISLRESGYLPITSASPDGNSNK